MILLAPRRVQEAFTSTTTTRKLESHGLLDEDESGTGRAGTGSDPRDRERARRNKEKEKERARQKEKRKKVEESKAKGKGKQSKDDSYIATSSGGSITSGSTLIASASILPPPSSAPSLHTYPPSSTASLHSSSSREPTFEDQVISRNSSLASRRRRRVRDPLDDSDDEDEDVPRPTRTPHSEAYGTVDASVIEQMRPRQDRSHADFDPNAGFLKRVFGGRTNHLAPGPSPSQLTSNYEPPWMTMASRNKQEQQQRVVDNLNTSFKDVGLLPSTHRDKVKHGSQKTKKIASGSANSVDIFEDVPPESLYMLLPLWPGSTDPVSERKASSYVKPDIPNAERQYLLVYYKVPLDAPGDERSGEPESKKRSRNSPTSSHDSQNKRDDNRASILLTTFHISARLVSYKDLQGSGVRVPDEGLSVAGSLEAAFAKMPVSVRPQGLFEFVLGICHSREAGIEFYPDGLLNMGLCLRTSEPVEPRSEEDMPPEPDIELTPLGRAVLEMAWLGAMALTSFGTAANGN
jgi:hypothetical protein